MALDKNQIKSVDLMLDYIVEYQNSYVFCNLFKYNLVELLEKNVYLSDLLESQIINHKFEFEEWPGTTNDTQKMFGAYNDSIFRLRKKFKYIFPQLVPADERFDDEGNPIPIFGGLVTQAQQTAQKVGDDVMDMLKEDNHLYKIEYQLNQLCSMSKEDGSIMDAVANSEEVDLFETDAVMDMIDFKWDRYASKIHLIGMIIHIIYMVYLNAYVKLTFVDPDSLDPNHVVPIHAVKDSKLDVHKELDLKTMNNVEKDDRIYPEAPAGLVIQGLLLVYPMLYSGRQCVRSGLVYFITPYYWIEILNIIFGWWSIYCQMYVGTWDISSKIVMITLIFICCVKTLFYLKILKSFSYIVTMVISVVYDLRYFVTFYIILLTFFSLLLDVVGRNYSKEYLKLSWFVGNWLAVFRLALGDFDFTLIENAPMTKTHILFWILWSMMVLFSSLIFLNFIIAQVSDSYARVKENIDSFIYKERAKLISEAEGLLSKQFKFSSKQLFPEYIVSRQLEDRIMKKKKKRGRKS